MESLKLKIVKSVVTEDLGYRRVCGERRLKPHQWGEKVNVRTFYNEGSANKGPRNGHRSWEDKMRSRAKTEVACEQNPNAVASQNEGNRAF